MVSEPSPKEPDDLESLARERFKPLSQAELKLLRAAPRGEIAWCGPSERGDDPANDPAKADQWGPEREIRAALIRWLAVDGEAASHVDPLGIQVHGAKMVGRLDLSFVTVPFRLRLWRCRLTDDARLYSAQLPALNLAGSWVRSIRAEGANVKGSVFLDEGFRAEGEVRLLGAQIGGSLDCSGGTFKNPEKDALSADRANVKGGVFLRHGFSAEGEVRLPGAQIGGNLECDGSTFKNAAQEGVRESGKALIADGAVVRGSVFLREGFNAEGEVWLLDAQIGRNLDCSGGTFKNPEKDALSADRANVKGSVFLDKGFGAEGEVRLLGAQISGALICRRASFSRLDADGATIKRALFWHGIQHAGETKLDLTNATAGALVDDEASWPAPGNLKLDGFVYDRISGGPRDAAARLRWLERQAEFRPQPYRQLARVLREEGDEQGAHKVLFEMEHRRRQKEDRAIARPWSWVLRWTIGYGFYRERAVVWLVFLSLVGSFLFGVGYRRGAIVPTDKEAYSVFQAEGRVPPHYPGFSPLIYSLENFVPLVNLGQKDYWTPDPHPQGSAVAPQSGWLAWLVGKNVPGARLLAQVTWAGSLRVFRWIQLLVGLMVGAGLGADVTGLVRRE